MTIRIQPAHAMSCHVMSCLFFFFKTILGELTTFQQKATHPRPWKAQFVLDVIRKNGNSGGKGQIGENLRELW